MPPKRKRPRANTNPNAAGGVTKKRKGNNWKAKKTTRKRQTSGAAAPPKRVLTRFLRGSGPAKGKPPPVADDLWRNVRLQPNAAPAPAAGQPVPPVAIPVAVEAISIAANTQRYLAHSLSRQMMTSTVIQPPLLDETRTYVRSINVRGVVESSATFQYRMLVCTAAASQLAWHSGVGNAADPFAVVVPLIDTYGNATLQTLFRSGVGAPFLNYNDAFNSPLNSPIGAVLNPGGEILHDSGTITHNVTGGNQLSTISFVTPINAYHTFVATEWVRELERELYFLMYIDAGSQRVRFKSGLLVGISFAAH